MPSKSKNKGSGAERELCKILAETYGGSFIRVPNSGAFIGGKNAHRRDVMSTNQVRGAKGDIVPPDHMPKLVLESKFYADFPFHSLMTDGKVPQLDAWIEQTLDCVEEGDIWFVAFKINRRGWFVCLPQERAATYTFGNHACYTDAKGKSFVVSDLQKFFKDNKDVVLEQTK